MDNRSPNVSPVYAGPGATDGIGSRLCRTLAENGTRLANHEIISAAKATVTGLAMSAATCLPLGLRVNVVAPGPVQTSMAEGVTRSDAARQASRDLHPLGRLGAVDDIVPLISYLLDPNQTWPVTQFFGVDAGLSTLRPLPRRASRNG